MTGATVTIVIPLFNQVRYTRLCLDSLQANATVPARIIVVDNGSSDGTGDYLATVTGVDVISNRENRGCAGAWNQGVAASDSEWIIILNNDVIVAPGWIEGLLAAAAEQDLDVVSPAIREGECNYDVAEYGRSFVETMGKVVRPGHAHGVCFMVHRRVFQKIGGFDEKFRIGQFEDADFYRRALLAGFRLGTTGRSFMHHFGSVTQDAIRKKKEPNPYEAENRAYYRAKWRLTWWRRMIERRSRKVRDFVWRNSERVRHGHSLKEKLVGGRLRYY